VPLRRHVRHQDDVERQADFLGEALAELLEPVVAQVEDVVDEVDELQVVAPLDVVDLVDHVRHGPLAHVLAVARAVDLLLPRVVEAERARHRAAALRHEHLAVGVLVDRSGLVDDVAVGEAEVLEVLDDRPDLVLVDLAGRTVLDPEVRAVVHALPVREAVQEVDDRGLALTAADGVHAVGVHVVRHERRVRTTGHRQHVRQRLLHLAVDVREVEVHARRHRVEDDVGVVLPHLLQPVLVGDEQALGVVPGVLDGPGQVHDPEHLLGEVLVDEQDAHPAHGGGSGRWVAGGGARSGPRAGLARDLHASVYRPVSGRASIPT
jgi:hypothetical protein